MELQFGPNQDQSRSRPLSSIKMWVLAHQHFMFCSIKFQNRHQMMEWVLWSSHKI